MLVHLPYWGLDAFRIGTEDGSTLSVPSRFRGPERQRLLRVQLGSAFSSPLLMATGGSIPLFCLEGVPAFPGASQDEAGLIFKGGWRTEGLGS